MDSMIDITSESYNEKVLEDTWSAAYAKRLFDEHANNIDNPHGVTKAQVGLSDVDNIKQATKAEFDEFSKMVKEDILNVRGKIPKKVSELENDSGFLTEHQNISHKANVTYVNSKVSEEAAARDYADAMLEGSIQDVDTKAEQANTRAQEAYDKGNVADIKADTLFAEKQDALAYDDIPIKDSENALTSGAVYNALLTNTSQALPQTLAVNTIYDLGEQNSLTLNLPAGQLGDFIEVDFLSTNTPTTLTITASSGISDYDLVPEENTIYSLYFNWIRLDASTYGWGFGYAEYTRTVA